MIIKEQYNLALQAAVQAGEAIMNVYASDEFEVEMKSDNSPLTRADMLAHDLIVTALKDTGIPLLSEESKEKDYGLRRNWKEFWLVDPLDGTKEFIKRNGEFTVNIALIKEGKAQVGIVYVPVSQELYFGVRGEGAYKLKLEGDNTDLLERLEKSQPLQVQMPQDKRLIVVGSRSHMSSETEAWIARFSSKYEIEMVSKGSSLKLCLVAEGKAHLYPRFAPTMEWDTAAGHAIAVAAGADVVDYHTKQELQYNKQNLLNPWFLVQPKGGIEK